MTRVDGLMRRHPKLVPPTGCEVPLISPSVSFVLTDDGPA